VIFFLRKKQLITSGVFLFMKGICSPKTMKKGVGASPPVHSGTKDDEDVLPGLEVSPLWESTKRRG
jgi:hypothetical protein